MPNRLRNILIRDLTDEESKAVEKLKTATGLRHASKAVMAAVFSFERRQTIIGQYKHEIERVKQENERIRRENCKLRDCMRRILDTGDRIRQIVGEDPASVDTDRIKA